MTITETSPTTPQIEAAHGMWPTTELSQRIKLLGHSFLVPDADETAASPTRVAFDSGFTRQHHDVTDVGAWRAFDAFGHVLAIMTLLAAVAVGIVILAGWSEDTSCLPNCTCVHEYGQPVGNRLTLNETSLSSSNALSRFERLVTLSAEVCAPQ